MLYTRSKNRRFGQETDYEKCFRCEIEKVTGLNEDSAGEKVKNPFLLSARSRDLNRSVPTRFHAQHAAGRVFNSRPQIGQIGSRTLTNLTLYIMACFEQSGRGVLNRGARQTEMYPRSTPIAPEPVGDRGLSTIQPSFICGSPEIFRKPGKTRSRDTRSSVVNAA